MLEQAKSTYEYSATSHIEKWNKMNKNDLVRLAVENKDNESFNGYISAIMLKYWDKMMSYYYKCKLVITPEDAHAWLVNAVMYAIDHHPWDNPGSSIYMDKNGPDKVINRFLESRRATFYQQLNRFNRKINSAMISLDTLTDGGNYSAIPSYEDDYTCEIDEMIQKYFDEKGYFMAFLIDSIVYDNHKITFYSTKLVSHLRSLDKNYCKGFSSRHSINPDRVARASTYITRMPRPKIKSKITESVEELKKVLTEQ